MQSLLALVAPLLFWQVADAANGRAAPSSISVMRPPITIEGNPYLERLVGGARADLAKPEKQWPKATEASNPFEGLSGESGSRDVAERMEAWLWLYANPASPMKGDAEVLRRFLTLASAYTDAMEAYGKDEKIKAGQGIFDDFAIAPAASAIREFAALYPDKLSPEQKAQWDRAMKYAGAVMWGKAKGRPGTYANIDLALAFELLNFGLYLGNEEYLKQSKFLWTSHEKSIYPDGGIAYIGHQNESANYHNTCMHFLTRIYEVTGDEKAAEMLRRSEWYGPVTSGRLQEFWTVPSWKDTWNTNDATAGVESVVALTGNGYVRAMCEHSMSLDSGNKKWASYRYGVPWYRGDVKAKELPDSYTCIDRNVAGPRAWYGRWTYAASLRPIPPDEPGLATIMGAMALDEKGGIAQTLMGVYPRVRLKAETITKDDKFDRTAYAWLTKDLKSSLVMGRTWSALQATYRLHQYGSSTKGPDADWNGRQVWLGLPDRVIGLIQISAATDNAKAIDVEGVLRLGTGGTINGKPTKIETLSPTSWRYGDLVITMHEHDFAKVETPEVPFRLPKFPNTEIRLIDQRGAANAGNELLRYPASTKLSFLVEVRYGRSASPAEVKQTEKGFTVALAGKRFTVLTNQEPRKALDGQVGADTVGPHGAVGVLVDSPDAEDKQGPWPSFADMTQKLSERAK
jgi:hypothetical protein